MVCLRVFFMRKCKNSTEDWSSMWQIVIAVLCGCSAVLRVGFRIGVQGLIEINLRDMITDHGIFLARVLVVEKVGIASSYCA